MGQNSVKNQGFIYIKKIQNYMNNYSYFKTWSYDIKCLYVLDTEYIFEYGGPWRCARVRDRWRHTQACRSTWICYQSRILRTYR